MRYTVDVTAGLAFGVDINTLESDHEVIQTHLDKVLPGALPARCSRRCRLALAASCRPTGRSTRTRELHRAVDGFIAQARARMDADPSLRARPRNLIEAMIAARDTDGSGLDDADVAGNVLTMLLAGEDTTANTLAWMIYLLRRHPEALRAGARRGARVVGAARPPRSTSRLARLDYRRGLRARDDAPEAGGADLISQAARDIVSAGIEVPAGALVIC